MPPLPSLAAATRTLLVKGSCLHEESLALR
jgi:hypothetical protein